MSSWQTAQGTSTLVYLSGWQIAQDVFKLFLSGWQIAQLGSYYGFLAGCQKAINKSTLNICQVDNNTWGYVS